MSRVWLSLLLCLLPLAAAAADPALGRLFLTPAERAALDVVRKNSKPPERIISPDDSEDRESTAAAAPPPIPPVVTVHGYVKRSDGKGTVWVNGQPVPEKNIARDIEVGRVQGNTSQVPIRIPGTGQTVRLKAGQSFDPASGKMADRLQDLPPRPDPSALPVAEEMPASEKAVEAEAPGKTAAGSGDKPTPAPAR